MIAPFSLRDIPKSNIFRKGDVFVLFGELFGRGYANAKRNWRWLRPIWVAESSMYR